MNEIKFSIILPTWNRAFCLSKMLDSILAQTINNYELIIVDDGSSDNTSEMIRQKYNTVLGSGRFKYFRFKKNKGVSAARNYGLQKSSNPWICYADSDNLMQPDFLETYYKLISLNPFNKCFYTQIQFDTGNKIIGQSFDYEKLKTGNFIDLGVFVHHRELYEKFGGFDRTLKRLVDWDLILRYTKHNTPVFLPKITVMYNNSNEFRRITNSEDYKINLAKIKKKHCLKNERKEPVMKMFWLKAMRFLHLITKEKYTERRAVALVNASSLFNADWYMTQNPDVKTQKIGAARHYVKFGWKEGRNPSLEFDGNAYLAANIDIAAAGINPLVHYLLHGAKEGRWYNKVAESPNFPQSNKQSLLSKIKNILEYPLEVKKECERLKKEIEILRSHQD